MTCSDGQTGRGLLLIISGPSGVGKTTITHEVERRLGGEFSVSCTTRPKTDADVEGRDYFFLTPERFEQMERRGEFLESAEVFGNRYATPREPVERALREGRMMILEIDVRGAAQVKRAMPDAFAVFVLPPSEEILLERLRARKRESEETIRGRFAEAKREIDEAKRGGIYDAFVVNDDLERAVEETVAIVRRVLADRG